MQIFHLSFTKQSRKQRPCDWCGEAIEVGGSYNRYGWRDGCSGGFCSMHPECYDASCELGKRDGEFQFMPGDFTRGCCCASGDCKCKVKE